MLRCLSCYQLAEWKAYYSIEPFGEVRADWRQGITSMILANANTGKKGRTYKVSDFMLVDKKRRKQSPEQMVKLLQTLC